jgi:DNA-binding XRE family transcriptional regulator
LGALIVHSTQLRAARAAACHTQQQAADTVRVARRTWAAWEAGINPMPAGLWLLYLILTGRMTVDEARDA